MTARPAASSEPRPAGSPAAEPGSNRPGLVSLLGYSAWCGLVAGLLEVGTIVLRKQAFDPNHLYGISRHFLWLVPLTNLCMLTALGLCGWIVCLASPGRGPWLVARVLFAVTILPVFFIAFPQIYSLAWLVAAFGTAVAVVPLFARDGPRLPPARPAELPGAAGDSDDPGGSSVGSRCPEAIARSARPLPPPGSPNVLLIVLDTVATRHLSLYGYDRHTSASLAELAERGVRFDSAQAASSWTLPSHATMFTGRWMHELSVGWLTPLDRARPTLAEFLRDRGYATAGFVANTMYCASDSGLDRGFTSYQDHIFPELTAFKTAVTVDRVLMGLHGLTYFLADWLEAAGLRPVVPRLWRLLLNDRKGAAVVNREFLDWLSRRGQPERPFLAFLNYFDAHYPYRLPPGRLHRFGAEPADARQQVLIQYWWDLDKTRLQPQELAFATDAYDDCIADLDEHLGSLFDELKRRGVLEQTWLIIASDHGESFGEHPGVFCHGSSLYQTELHVPLLVIPPGGTDSKLVVKETVSLRDLPATIVDVLGLDAGSPFPGVSLARFWNTTAPAAAPARASLLPALAEVVPNDPSNLDASGLPKKAWPLGALIQGEWSYIRHEGDRREELFHLRADAREERNLAGEPDAQPTLIQLRDALGRLTAGPLVPKRFSR